MPITNSMIYLDHNATTLPDPQVLAAMQKVAAQAEYNPSSAHAAGRLARMYLEDAREDILRLLGADPVGDRLIFTSGGTEANNLALFGLAGPCGSRVVISAIEHPSVHAAADQLAARGYDVQRAPVSPDGVVLLDRFAALLTADTRLVSVMLANHETGAIQPLPEIASLCRARQILVHTDAAQAIGKIPFDFAALGVDAVTLVPHKFHGPRGVGGLLLRRDLQPPPQLFGGPQQFGVRPGTECVSLAVGMHKALALYFCDPAGRSRGLQRRRDLLAVRLAAIVPARVVIAAAIARTPQTLCVAFPGLNRQALAMALDRAGIACSTGSACASGSPRPSPVLQAMGLPDEVIQGALRFSVGITTTDDEVVRAAETIGSVVASLRSRRGNGD